MPNGNEKKQVVVDMAPAAYERFRLMMEELGYSTNAEFVRHLLERFDRLRMGVAEGKRVQIVSPDGTVEDFDPLVSPTTLTTSDD